MHLAPSTRGSEVSPSRITLARFLQVDTLLLAICTSMDSYIVTSRQRISSSTTMAPSFLAIWG